MAPQRDLTICQANYDAAWKKFFVDKRLQDCGVLVVSPGEDKYLQKVFAQKIGIEIDRVRLVRMRCREVEDSR